MSDPRCYAGTLRPIVIVTGSRDWRDCALPDRVLTDLNPRLLVHGACPVGGADWVADEWAKRHAVPVEPVPAVRHLDGPWPKAGPNRNLRMLRMHRDAILLAMPLAQSRGTIQCLKAARKLGMTVIVVGPMAELV